MGLPLPDQNFKEWCANAVLFGKHSQFDTLNEEKFTISRIAWRCDNLTQNMTICLVTKEFFTKSTNYNK